MAKEYFEYRGVSNGVYAEVLTDTSEGITFGTVKEFTGLAEVGKTTESSNEPHYYDNIPAIVVSSTGADTLSLNTSGIPLEMLADITGQMYDSDTGMLVEKERTPKYFALGYVTQKTDGTKVLVWRLKGSFTIPEQTSATQTNGTEANGQTLTYTGISTTYKFNSVLDPSGDKCPAKAVNIDTSVNQSMTESAFFATVHTPDDIASGKTPTGIAVIPSTLALAPDETYQLRAELTPPGAVGEVTFESSATGKATVGQTTGLVTAVTDGSATITATCGLLTDTCAVTVATPSP